MARIRTIKPDFFRHEGLQDLAAKHGAEVMLVFAGLWGHCDKAGRFEWKPRTLKLDILPFLDFDMAKLLHLLSIEGFVRRYSADGKEYGVIETFAEHQRIGGKEAQEPAKYPEPPANNSGNTEHGRETNGESQGKQSGSTGEATGIAGREGEGKGIGREEEEEGKGSAALPRCSPQGEICRAIKQAGIAKVNPSHPTLLALIDAGATVEEFTHAAVDAKAKDKPDFNYVLGIVKGRREEAAKLLLHKGALPAGRMSANDQSKLAAARAIFGTEIEGNGYGAGNVIDVTPTARQVGG